MGRAFSEDYDPGTTERLAVITVDHNREAMKTLILREIPETRATDIVSDEDSMAACDVALFVHDSSREGRERLKLFAQLAQVVGSGFKVPCFIVDAKDDDLGMRLEFKRRTKSFGLQRIPVNLKLGEFNDLACRIVAPQSTHTEICKIFKFCYTNWSHHHHRRPGNRIPIGSTIWIWTEEEDDADIQF